jgi:RNA polymerase sigma-70 factor (sigma-E family)
MSEDDDFSQYVAARWPRLVRCAVLMGCTPVEAEDLAQATVERCLLKWSRVQRAQDRDAYVHRILINTFRASLRRRWTGEQPTEHLPDRHQDNETGRIDDADAVVRALQRLSADQRCVVVLRYYVHLREHQTASALGIAPRTVKSRLSRALKTLGQDPSLIELRGSR